jgi:hypothetical protein
MSRLHFEAAIATEDAIGKELFKDVPSLPEGIRYLGNNPSCASGGWKRTLFKALYKMGLVNMDLNEVDKGVFVFTVRAPMYRWSFSMGPELVVASLKVISVISINTLRSFKAIPDVTLIYDKQVAFIPSELIRTFFMHGEWVAESNKERIDTFNQTLRELAHREHLIRASEQASKQQANENAEELGGEANLGKPKKPSIH